jgi:hypothetical protein
VPIATTISAIASMRTTMSLVTRCSHSFIGRSSAPHPRFAGEREYTPG